MAGRWRASGLATNLVPLLILLVGTIADTTDPDAKDVPGASTDADDADAGCAAKNLDPETGHGGWGSDEIEPPLRGNCDIDRVAAADLGTLDFAGEYKGKKPLVVTGATDAWGAKVRYKPLLWSSPPQHPLSPLSLLVPPTPRAPAATVRAHRRLYARWGSP